MDPAVQRGTLRKPEETYVKVKAADGIPIIWQRHCATLFLANWQMKRQTQKHTTYLRHTKERP